MKRYALFAGSHFYPGGGWHDFIGMFETMEDALMKAASMRANWKQIVDLQTEEEVWAKV